MTKTQTKKILLKDILFNPVKVQQIASEIRQVYPSFKHKEFVDETVSKFPNLELKARISWIADCLKKHLPSDYIRAVKIIIRALPEPNNPNLSDDDFGDFIYAPYSDYVATNGCTKEHLKLSLTALYEITQRFSAEDAIRYFINAFPKETLKVLQQWSKDPHYHVRRLCSEGTRPKLPWSQKLNIPVTAPISILNNLFSDKTRFVTRSVANHINDISKIDPDLAIQTLTKWKKLEKQKESEMGYITRHSLRTLIKHGNPDAMKLLGLNPLPPIRVTKFHVPEVVKMNSALKFSFSITSKEETEIIVDYILYFQNKAGKLNSKKVFKLTKLSLSKNKSVETLKSHLLRKNMTTRTLYPGQHRIELQVNGKVYAQASFLLK
jgi:3-methyladenine DNA glycosylase AlkC